MCKKSPCHKTNHCVKLNMIRIWKISKRSVCFSCLLSLSLNTTFFSRRIVQMSKQKVAHLIILEYFAVHDWLSPAVATIEKSRAWCGALWVNGSPVEDDTWMAGTVCFQAPPYTNLIYNSALQDPQGYLPQTHRANMVVGGSRWNNRALASIIYMSCQEWAQWPARDKHSSLAPGQGSHTWSRICKANISLTGSRMVINEGQRPHAGISRARTTAPWLSNALSGPLSHCIVLITSQPGGKPNLNLWNIAKSNTCEELPLLLIHLNPPLHFIHE